MAENTPKISVVIPALNEEKYLGKCLESFQNQTFKDFETIVADGGSTDKTREVAQKFGAKIIQLENSNICQARQAGLEEARGEIVVGADADNTYPADHLERIVGNFHKYQGTIGVVGGGIFEKHPFWGYYGWKFQYWVINIIFKLSGFVLYGPAFNMSFLRKKLLEIGGYRTYLDYGGDEMDILERLRKVGRVIFDENLVSYASSRRLREGSIFKVFLHWIYYYYLNYFLAKIFKKQILRGKPVR